VDSLDLRFLVRYFTQRWRASFIDICDRPCEKKPFAHSNRQLFCSSGLSKIRWFHDLWSQLLLVDPDASWQGQIWGYCFECSGIQDQATFIRERRKRKEQRAKFVRGRRQRARCVNFNTTLQVVEELFPGASGSKRRQLAVMRSKAVASAFMRGFEKSNPLHQSVCHEITQQWLCEMQKAADEPSYACKVDSNSLNAEEASYLTDVGGGISLSFLCRMPGCLFFGLNSTWIKEAVVYHFKCPMCFQFFKPWAAYKAAVKACYCLLRGLLHFSLCCNCCVAD